MSNIKVKFHDENVAELIVSESQYRKLIDTIDTYVKAGYTIMLTVNPPIDCFQRDFGKLCSKHSKVFEDDDTAYELIGKMTLDYYIKDTYFVKSIAEKTVYEIRKEGIGAES